MILSLYILFVIIAFLFFIMAVFFNQSYANLFLWPVAVILFGALFFASYNIQTSTTVVSAENVTILTPTTSRTVYEHETARTVFTEPAFNWVFLALSLLSSVLFIWDIFNKKIEETPNNDRPMQNNNNNYNSDM